jgi:hypothetical protein
MDIFETSGPEGIGLVGCDRVETDSNGKKNAKQGVYRLLFHGRFLLCFSVFTNQPYLLTDLCLQGLILQSSTFSSKVLSPLPGAIDVA